jgi:hypothetical protein
VSAGKQASAAKKSEAGKQKGSSKQPSAKKDKKQEQHTSKAGKQSTKKASVVKVTKKGDKAPSPKTASAKQQ